MTTFIIFTAKCLLKTTVSGSRALGKEPYISLVVADVYFFFFFCLEGVLRSNAITQSILVLVY
jgi:hypothetical protein